MCFFRVKNIFAIFIIPIFWNILDGMVFASSDNIDDLNEIKTLFNRPNNTKHNELLLKENAENKNFAEGGLITSYSSTALTVNNTSVNLQQKVSVESHQNKSNSSLALKDLKITAHNNSDINPLLNSRPTTLTKLIDGGANLFLGAPEVVHINGTSSIKPRKGVYYNKIVPRKGVDPENEFTHNAFNKCLLLWENECYVTPLNFQDLESFCCNKTSADIIKTEMPSINCSSCNSTNILYYKSCQHVCFRNITDTKKTQELQTEVKKQDNTFDNKSSSNITTSKKTLIIDKSLENISASLNKNLFTNSLKKLKSKPKITKVPDDIEFVDDLFSRSKRDVLMPILVSLFLLPLIGMLIFFIWRRTKEYWSKRYYKRMDFLIDGMYNDLYS